MQVEWLAKLPSIRISLLKRNISDHCPLLLQPNSSDWGPRPFKFQDAWVSHKRFTAIIEASWNNASGKSLMAKLKNVKINLKTWNAEVFGNIDSNIIEKEADIQKWDVIANSRDLEQDEIKKKSSGPTGPLELASQKRSPLGSKFSDPMGKAG